MPINQFQRGGLPGYLADCNSKDPSLSELYIVGSFDFADIALESRDRKFQAIMCVEDDVTGQGEDYELLSSESNLAIIAAIGAGIVIRGPKFPINAKTFRLDQVRYAKIFVVTDDSAEGCKLKDGILELMVRTLWPVIDNGQVFLPTAPLAPDISRHEFVERVIDPESRQFVQYKLPS